jgi:hypothetical protein
MNTGIGDSINLAWKLRAVLSGRAPDALLDTYEAERRAFALRLVQTTDRVFTFVASEGHLAEIVRTRVAPIILPYAIRFEAVRDWIFLTVSQITLNYRGKGLDQGHAGAVYGGDRLPWLKLGADDNYSAFKRIGWHVHVYGTAAPDLRRWCDARALDLQVYPWRDGMQEAGFRLDALYLIRPDSYVAVAELRQDLDALERYEARTGISLG